MLEIYIKFENGHLTGWSNEINGSANTPAFLIDEAFYPERLDGYALDTSAGMGQYRLYFDTDLYSKRQYDKAKEKAEEAAQALYEKKAMENLLRTATDDEALEMRVLYPDFAAGVEYKTGDRINYGGHFYKVLQDHTSAVEWIPPAAASLYAQIADPAAEWPEYEQPTGAYDTYEKGDKVTYKGFHYISKMNANAFSPDAYPDGWEKVE